MPSANSPTSIRRIEAAERRQQAMNLRLAGASFEQIGRQLGVRASAAHKMVMVGLAAIAAQTAESAEQVRSVELARLDALQAALWSDAMKGDEQKIDRIVRIMARRAALLGLDAPTKQQIEGGEHPILIAAYRYGDGIKTIAAPDVAPGPEPDSPASGVGEGDGERATVGKNGHGGERGAG